MTEREPWLRHIVIAVAELDASARLMTQVLGVQEAFREPPGLGLEMVNVVMPVGQQFLEVCAGTHDQAPTARFVRRTGGPGGFMVLLQYHDFETARDRAVANGARLVWEHDEPDQRECHLHPKDVGGAMVGVEWTRQWADWRWAGARWREHVRPGASAVTSITLSSDDPARVARRWSALLGLQFETSSPTDFVSVGAPERIAIRRWDRTGDQLTGVGLTVADVAATRGRAEEVGLPIGEDSVDLLGLRFDLRAE